MKKEDCRGCKSKKLNKILSLGLSPLANNLLDSVEKCDVYPLDLNLCLDCYNCQLSHVVPPDRMFRNYLYVSSTTESFRKHFKDAANEYINRFNLDENSFVIDIGSNDGIGLKPFFEKGIKVLGVEPASNICDIALENDIDTYCEYFNDEVVNKIEQKADLITASNVFAHADDLESIAKNVFKVLKKDGCFVIEVQYLLRTIEDGTFDNIYHEHVNYWSVTSLNIFFDRLGFQICDVQNIDTHGGSIRVFIKNKGCDIKGSVDNFLQKEILFGIKDISTYKNFSEKVLDRKNNLLSVLHKLKNEGHKIIGYGAPAKATTLLNAFDIDNEILECTIDDNPLKHNKVIPKVNIPIQSKIDAINSETKYIVVLAWNFYREIIKNNIDLLNKGIEFIVPTQEIKIINKGNYKTHV